MTDSQRVDDLYAELEHRKRQIRALRHVTEAVFDHLTVDDILNEILRVAVEVLRADAGSLQLYEPATDSLVFRYVQDSRAADVPIGYSMPVSQGIAGRVFRTGVSDICHNVAESPDFNPEVDQLTGYRTQSMLTAALKRFGGEPR